MLLSARFSRKENKMKKIAALILCLGVAFSFALTGFAETPTGSVPAEAPAANSGESVVSGVLNENFSWTLDKAAGLLTLSGNGEMPFISSEESGGTKVSSPWAKDSFFVRKVVVQEGITSISAGAFQDARSLAEVQLPSSLRIIGDSAFKGCLLLDDVQVPEGVELIDSSAFYGCKSLTKLGLPRSLHTISNQAFQQCDSLRYIYYTGSKPEWKNIAIDESLVSKSMVMVSINGESFMQSVTTYSNDPIFDATVYYESAFGEVNNEKNSWLARLFS